MTAILSPSAEQQTQLTPLQSVETLFARMATRYGSAWINLWEGVDIAGVKADWLAELRGLSVRRVRYGIANLPLERPPATAGAFKAICLRCPDEQPKLLADEVRADPKRVNATVQFLKAKLTKPHRLQWAYDLQAREAGGEELTGVQQRMWRTALERVQPANMTFANIDPACLPPGMRPREQDEAFRRAEDQALEQYYGDERA